MKIKRCSGGKHLHSTGHVMIELLNGKTIQLNKTRRIDTFMQAIGQVNQEFNIHKGYGCPNSKPTNTCKLDKPNLISKPNKCNIY